MELLFLFGILLIAVVFGFLTGRHLQDPNTPEGRKYYASRTDHVDDPNNEKGV